MHRTWIAIGALVGFSAVAMAAVAGGWWLAHCAWTVFTVGIALFCAGVYLHVLAGLRLPMAALPAERC